jgi:hypothetical protein
VKKRTRTINGDQVVASEEQEVSREHHEAQRQQEGKLKVDIGRLLAFSYLKKKTAKVVVVQLTVCASYR